MVSNPVPKWVWKRYALLWKKFGEDTFTYPQAEKVLKFDKKSAISVMFMELRKAGWVNIELSQEDARTRTYKLTNPINVVEATVNDFKKR